MTGDGIWRTITDITTAHTAWELPGIGADTIVRTGAAGAIAHGDITATAAHGTTEDGTAHGDSEDGMTHGTAPAGTTLGITEVTMEATMEAGTAGTTHGITIITTAGMTRSITTVMAI